MGSPSPGLDRDPRAISRAYDSSGVRPLSQTFDLSAMAAAATKLAPAADPAPSAAAPAASFSLLLARLGDAPGASGIGLQGPALPPARAAVPGKSPPPGGETLPLGDELPPWVSVLMAGTGEQLTGDGEAVAELAEDAASPEPALLTSLTTAASPVAMAGVTPRPETPLPGVPPQTTDPEITTAAAGRRPPAASATAQPRPWQAGQPLPAASTASALPMPETVASELPAVEVAGLFPSEAPPGGTTRVALEGAVGAMPGGPPQLAPTSAGKPAGAELELASPFSDPGWGEELGQSVAVHVSQGGRSAELRVNPAELGPVELRVAVDRDRAVVTFIAQDAAVREALQEALPRLRDALQAQGLQLADARVAADGGGQQPRGPGSQAQAWTRPGQSGEDLEPQAVSGLRRPLGSDGALIDAYA